MTRCLALVLTNLEKDVNMDEVSKKVEEFEQSMNLNNLDQVKSPQKKQLLEITQLRIISEQSR